MILFNGIQIACFHFKRRENLHIDTLGISGSPYLYKKWLTFLTDTKMSDQHDKNYPVKILEPQNRHSKFSQLYRTYEETRSSDKNKIFIGWLINTYG